MEMSKEQIRMIEDNHNLIYSFIHSKSLDLSEHYGLIAESLMKAVVDYDSSKGKLSTFFYYVANNNLRNYFHKSSLELENMKDCEGNKITSLFGNRESIDVGTYDTDNLLGFDSVLEDLDYEMNLLAGYLVEGYTQSEIAELVGANQTAISRKIKKLRETVGEILC